MPESSQKAMEPAPNERAATPAGEPAPDTALLATLIEEALQGILIHRHTVPLYANKAMLAMFGYESLEAVRELGPSFNLMAPQEHSRLENYHRTRLKGGASPTRYEAVGMRKDGSTFTVEVVNRLMRWQGEDVVYSSFTDISERKAAEDALKESERNYRILVEEASDAMFITDLAGNFLMVNQRAVDLCGYTLEEWQGLRLRDVMHEEDIGPYLASLEELSLTGASKHESRVFHKLEGWIALEVTARRIGRNRVQAIARDVTHRREAEVALLDRTHRLQQMIDALPLLITVKDLEGRYIAFNRQWKEFTGWHADGQTDVKSLHDYELATPEEVSHLMVLDEQVIRTGRSVMFEEVTHTRPDGRRITVILSKVPLKDDEGRITGILSASMDITKRKQAEEDLAAERRLFRTMFDAIPYWVYVKDTDSRYVMLNKALADFYRDVGGLEEQELIGMHIRDIPVSTPEEKARYLEEDRRMFETGVGKVVETTFTLADGTLRHQLESKYPVRDEHGRIVGQVGMSQDITAQKEAEAAIRESEMRFRQLFENSLQGVAIHVDHRILLANTALATMLGYGHPAELAGQDTEILMAPQEVARLREFYRKRLNGEAVPLRYEFEGRRKDGSPIWLEIHSTVIEWEGRSVVQAVMLDVTERREADAERRRLARAVDQAGDLILITDRHGIILYTNPAFEKITGFTRAEAIGTTPRLLKSGMQEEQFYRDMWGTIMKGETWVGHYINQRKDGTLFHVDAVHSPIKNDEGEVTHIIAVHHDITDRIDLEDQLRQSQKMEAMGQLAGGMAHEFNNLLQIIKGYSELMVRGMPKENPHHNHFNHIIGATEKAAQLTSHLLSFTRQQPLRLHPIDLNELVVSLGTIVRPLLGVNISLHTDLAENLPRVPADTLMIEQVLVNLCINARDAMPDGGALQVTTRLIRRQPGGEARSAGDAAGAAFVRLSFTDTGSGIPQEIQQSIFDPFFSTKDPGKGTGLGLSMAYGIVEQHKGMIEVESVPGEGATFHIDLPALLGPEPARPSLSQNGKGVVLLAESNSALQGMLLKELQQAGYRVVMVPGAEQFAEHVVEHRDALALAIVDEVLPRFDATHIYESLRGLDPQLPILLCTSGVAHREGSFPADARLHVIPKPMTVERIMQGVRKALENRAGMS